ncbi:MAG: acylphosphatase [Opitutales bacterium]
MEANPTEGTQTREIWFSGRVQGVGFRYSTSQIARGYAVRGSVRNLPDGRVHVLAYGASEEIDAFVAQILEDMAGFIRSHEEKILPEAAVDLAGFRIVH